MAAYYNEIDRRKAAWLRELIARNLIAPGDVDERSIVDVRPADLRGYRQCHFFSGIGIWSYALRLAGWPDDREVWTGSCPCQPFSAAGKGEAFDDERHLWPEFFRLIEARRPGTVFGEQVSSIDGLAWFDAVRNNLDDADYTVGCLDTCAAGVGAPHRRQRLYWVAHAEKRAGGAFDRESGESDRLQGAAGGHGVSGLLANDQSNGRGEECPHHRGISARDGAQGWPAGSDAGCESDGLGNSSGPRLEERRSEPGDSRQERAATERTGGAGGMEDALRPERREDQRQQHGYRQAPGRDQGADRSRERSETDWLGDSQGADRRLPIRQRGSLDNQAQSERAGPVNGFWRSADWVLTRPQRVGDRPGLRPVERGSFPLAHGTTERVGRLCADCLDETEIADSESLRSVRTITLAAGGRVPPQVLQPGVLLESPHQNPENKTRRSRPSADSISESAMREMRNMSTGTASPSQGSEPNEQSPIKCSDTLQEVPCCDPSRACGRCGQQGNLYEVQLDASRVGRLLGYGDGIIAEQAAAFIKACIELDSNPDRKPDRETGSY